MFVYTFAILLNIWKVIGAFTWTMDLVWWFQVCLPGVIGRRLDKWLFASNQMSAEKINMPFNKLRRGQQLIVAL